MRAPLGCREVLQVQQCLLALSLTPASDGRANTGSLPSRSVPLRHSDDLCWRWPGLLFRASLFCQVGSVAAVMSVAVPAVCSSLQIGRLPFGRNRAPRSDCYRRAGSLVWVCSHHGLNSLQPPVPILAALGYKPNTSLKARAADRKSTRLNSSHSDLSRMPSSA